MSDYTQLKKLLWAEVAAWSANCESWQRSSEAVGEFLGKKTVEEVMLELIDENERIDGCCKEMATDIGKLTRERNSFRSSAEKLKAENEVLREANDKFSRRNGMLEGNVQGMTETHVLYTWLRKKVDQPSNDFVAVQMNIGHDWVPVHDLDRDLRSMIEREEP